MHFKIILLFILKSIISESSAAVYVLNLQKPENNMLHWNDGVNLPTRRLYSFHPGHTDTILGAPRTSMHLPEAEPILPGHTLLRPGFSMLRSAVKFPHKDYVDGSGVYGNLNNLGITYDNTGERVLYTGFRRYDANNLINDISDSPGIIVLLRPKEKNVLSSSKTRDWPQDRSLHAKIPMQKYNFDFGSQLDYVRYNENEP